MQFVKPARLMNEIGMKKKKLKMTKQAWLTLFALSLALFIVVLDGSIMNVSMKAIAKDLGTSFQNMQVLITYYSLVLAALTLIGARLGDIYGRKRVFLIGTALFGLGALIASISKNSIMLLIGWSFIEGIGAALMMPATVSLMSTSFRGEARAIGYGVWGGVAAAGASIGPIIGGYVTTYYTWRLAFFLELIPVFLVFVLAKYIVDKKEYILKERRLDIWGSVLSSFGLGLLIFGILKVNDYGWFIPKANTPAILGLSISFLSMLFGLLLIVGLIIAEIKCKQKEHCYPLIEIDLFKNRQFNVGLLITLMQSLAQAGMLFVLPLFLLTIKGYTAIQTGIALLPVTISVLVFSAGLSRLKVDVKIILVIGFILVALSSYWLANILAVDLTMKDLIGPLAVFGAGLGLIAAKLTNIVISAFDVKRASEASGINATLRRLGAALGTAIMGTILFMQINKNLTELIRHESSLPSFVKEKIVSAISSSHFKIGTSGSSEVMHTYIETKSNVNNIFVKQITHAVQKDLQKAIIQASKTTLVITSLATLVTMCTVLLLPKRLQLSN